MRQLGGMDAQSAGSPARAPAARHTPRAPGTRLAPPTRALRRSERCDLVTSHQLLYGRIRAHRARLEHLVSSGATSAADLQPVVSELRLIADLTTASGAWDRMRDQLQALERALAAASAPGHTLPSVSAPGSSSSSSSSSSSAAAAPAATTTSSSSSLAAAAAAAPQQQQARSGRVSVRTAAGATLDLAVPDLDSAPSASGLQPPAAASPRLSACGRVSVCTGRKCCSQGAMGTLAAAQAAADGSGVEVVASKCMGKCGRGPCVRTRVAGREGSALTKGVAAEDVTVLLRQTFGTTC